MDTPALAQMLPPLNDAILISLAKLVDDAQATRREPSHDQLGHCIERAGLREFDPANQGQTYGKAKRVRAVLSQALSDNLECAQNLTALLIGQIRGLGGFRNTSPNFVGNEAICNLQAAFALEGFILTDEGELSPRLLDSLNGSDLTEALSRYVRRAQRGSEDAALVSGTGKDLLEATAAHVLQELWGSYSAGSNFPTLLGQAFVAVGFKTPQDKAVEKEPALHRLQRSLYETACAANTLRNKEGTGHGRPWLSTVTSEEAHVAIQIMGTISGMLLSGLKSKQK